MTTSTLRRYIGCPLLVLCSSLTAPLCAQTGRTEAAIEQIRRMDADNDGKLSPEEIPASARAALSKLADEAGLSSEKSLPLKRLERQLRRDEQGSSSDESRPEKESAADRAANEPKPSEPVRAIANATQGSSANQGFGAASSANAVQGFGNEATSPQDLESRFDPRTIASTDSFMRQYDRNKNGQLDASELSSLRWADDPKKSDLNGDGILSRSELAERMGKRFGRSRANATAPSKSGGFGSSSSTSAQTVPLNEKVRSYAKGFVSRYDTNGNGVLEKDEWSKMRQKYHSADTNNDSIITTDELAIVLGDYSRGAVSRKTNGSTNTNSTNRVVSKSDEDTRAFTGRRIARRSRGRDDKPEPKKSYRFLTPTERLDDLIPSKQRAEFTKLDRNGDGQIAMAEFATSWTEKKVAEFAKLDANGDGLVTPGEYVGE